MDLFDNIAATSIRPCLQYTFKVVINVHNAICMLHCASVHRDSLLFFSTHFLCQAIMYLLGYYPENPKGTQLVIVGSMNMGYISDTARNRTHNLFRPKREPIPLGHSDGILLTARDSSPNM